MKIQRIANGLTYILIFLCVIMVFIIIRQWNTKDNSAALFNNNKELTGIKDNSFDKISGISHSTININQFTDILDRPLFIEGRLPFEEEQTAKDQTKNHGPLKLRLEGVVLSPAKRVAVVRDLTNNEVIRFEVGMIHNGWNVKNIEKKSVELVKGDAIQNIQLELVKEPIEKAKRAGFKLPIQRRAKEPKPRK